MRRSLALVVLCSVTATAPAQEPSKTAGPRLRVPPAWSIDKVAGEPDVMFPMFATFDDRGRLFVAESSGLDLYAELQALTRRCRIRVLEDPDEHGRFRRSHVFADNLVFPMGLAWRDGKLYVADPPDVIALEDTDGDGKADKRTVILSGFGHRDNGSLHGLVFGPDGLLYLTTGHPDGYKIEQADGQVVSGRSGGLLRCRPDGSHPEVLCRGFENLVEVAFTGRGEIIGTDNWFRLPGEGVRDALVHLVEGGLYPRHFDQGTPQLLSGEPLPAVSLYPAVALSGLMRYRSPALGAAGDATLFSAQHNARKVVRHVLVPAGSTFRTEDHDLVTTDDPDFHPSDVLEDADGSLLVLDTGSWYVHHCPTGQIRKVRAAGGIYRVRPAGWGPVRDPWGLQIDWARAPAERLAPLLGDPRPMVRERAQRTLTARGKAALPILVSFLNGRADTSARQHALWALTGIPDEAAAVTLRDTLRSADSNLVATAARGLARRGDGKAAPALAHLLGAADPGARLAAAEALAHCGDAGTLPFLWQALSANPERFLEHSLIHAAHLLADAAALEEALKHSSPRVRQAALLLLDQPPRPPRRLGYEHVRAGLTSADPDLRRTALFVLRRHPEWAEHALDLLSGWLHQPRLRAEEEPGLRDLLLAFQGQRPVQDLVGAAVAGRDEKVSAQSRLLVLESLAQSSLPRLPAPWIEGLAQALRDPLPAVRLQAVRTAGVLQTPQLAERLAQLAESQQETPGLRLEALRALVPHRPRLSAEAFALLVRQLGDKEDPLARLSAAEVLGRAQLDEAQLGRLLAVLRGDALISPTVLLPALGRSTTAASSAAVLDYLAGAVRRGWRPGEAELNRILKSLPEADLAGMERVRAALRESVAGQKARLAHFEPLLSGGDAERGRAVFFGKKVACATCHSIGRDGGRIGPDLTRIGAVRSGPDILEAIVLPSSTIAQGYENYWVAAKDGRVVTGVIARQSTDVVVLRDSSGAEVRLPRGQIQEMSRLATSLMPEGLEQALSPEEFRDLLAFLQSRK